MVYEADGAGEEAGLRDLTMIRSSSHRDKETDTDKEKLQHGFRVYMDLLMSTGGLLLGTISINYGLILPSVVPYG